MPATLPQTNGRHPATETETRRRASRSENPGFVELITGLRDDAELWLSQEVELAKAEISEKIAEVEAGFVRMAASAVLLGTAGLLALLAIGFGAGVGFEALGLSIVPALALGFASVAIIAALAGWIAFRRASKRLSVSNLKPTRTTESLKNAKNLAKSKLSS